MYKRQDPKRVASLRAELPELPLVKRARFIDDWSLSAVDADNLLAEPANTRFFEDAVAAGRSDVAPRRIAAMLLNAGAKRANEAGVALDGLGVTPDQVADIVRLQDGDKVSASAADTLFGHACASDDTAEALAEAHGLLQVSDDGALDAWIAQVIADPKNEKAVGQIKEGKEKAVSYTHLTLPTKA